jgi:putative N-acetylmannosamine-6-phosphate epimerase
MSRWESARGRQIVSCQAREGEAFSGEGLMARSARAAEARWAGGVLIAPTAESAAELTPRVRAWGT